MGRQNTHAFQVKNTFVELVPSEETDFSRSQRAMSAGDADGDNAHLMQVPQDDNFMAQTPSPFLHPAQAPDGALLQMPPLNQGYEFAGSNLPIAFGDLPADFNVNGFDGGDADANYAQGMTYDPVSGTFVAYDWASQFGHNGYNMMGAMPIDGSIEEFQIDGCIPMVHCGTGHTDQLLAALSEKLAAGKGPEGIDAYGLPSFGESSLLVQEAIGGSCDVLQGQEALMDPNCELYPGMDMQGAMQCGGAPMDHSQQQGDGRSRKNRNRDRGDRESRRDRDGRVDGGERIEAGMDAEVPQQNGPVTFTTVMFRNIPNKYTREMLVKQLEQDLKGHFDFVYLPIDFKNKCNVGYAFINFRSIEACETFLLNFNGVEVRKCLPGLNSRKVTEVTPARVQGFEENVQRLRNSPVMRELAHHTEWMPLIFDENGDQQPFPAPERPLEPIKPRRRGREDAARDA